MIYQRKCNLCGEVIKVNGYINMDFKKHEHLKIVHPEEYLERSNLCYAVTEAQRNVDNFWS